MLGYGANCFTAQATATARSAFRVAAECVAVDRVRVPATEPDTQRVAGAQAGCVLDVFATLVRPVDAAQAVALGLGDDFVAPTTREPQATGVAIDTQGAGTRQADAHELAIEQGVAILQCGLDAHPVLEWVAGGAVATGAYNLWTINPLAIRPKAEE